jgi:DNA-binding MarR family transcriptional regulator
MELLYFGHAHLTKSADRVLAAEGLGRAHHRALYFVARKPDLTVSELLSLLAITKQSLVETRAGDRDRRQRLLRLTPAGVAMESDLFEGVRQLMSAAYASAGQAAVAGYWAVLEGLIPEEERGQVQGLRD